MDENKLRIPTRSELDEWIKKVCIEQNIGGARQPCEDAISRSDMLDAIGHGTTYTSEELQRIIKGLPPVNPQKCDRCEVGNPCLYCRHEFEPQERSDKE